MYITDVTVSGLEASIKASGLPMQTEPHMGWVDDKDLSRASKLASTPMGSGHDNYLNGIVVHFFLQCSNKMWVELERYHFIEFVSSQSTMHRLSKFNLQKQYNEYVDERAIDLMIELQAKYNETKNEKDFLRLLYTNPSGFELGAFMVTNYRQLRTMYHQRKTHRLPEWREFCKWCETLPHSEFITGEQNANQ